MKRIKNLISLGIITFIGSISKVYAVSVWTFRPTEDTADHDWSQVDGSRSVLDIISFINGYLWFAIGFFCFLFMIWNGFKLISANGDDKAIGTAKKAILGSGIGIVVCLLAYTIVNLAVKLFA